MQSILNSVARSISSASSDEPISANSPFAQMQDTFGIVQSFLPGAICPSKFEFHLPPPNPKASSASTPVPDTKNNRSDSAPTWTDYRAFPSRLLTQLITVRQYLRPIAKPSQNLINAKNFAYSLSRLSDETQAILWQAYDLGVNYRSFTPKFTNPALLWCQSNPAIKSKINAFLPQTFDPANLSYCSSTSPSLATLLATTRKALNVISPDDKTSFIGLPLIRRVISALSTSSASSNGKSTVPPTPQNTPTTTSVENKLLNTSNLSPSTTKIPEEHDEHIPQCASKISQRKALILNSLRQFVGDFRLSSLLNPRKTQLADEFKNVLADLPFTNNLNHIIDQCRERNLAIERQFLAKKMSQSKSGATIDTLKKIISPSILSVALKSLSRISHIQQHPISYSWQEQQCRRYQTWKNDRGLWDKIFGAKITTGKKTSSRFPWIPREYTDDQEWTSSIPSDASPRKAKEELEFNDNDLREARSQLNHHQTIVKACAFQADHKIIPEKKTESKKQVNTLNEAVTRSKLLNKQNQQLDLSTFESKEDISST